MSLFLLLSAKHNLLCLTDSFVLYATVGFLHSFLTSSSCHPKIFVKEFSYFLMSCH